MRVCHTSRPAKRSEKGSKSKANIVMVFCCSRVRNRWFDVRLFGRIEIFASSCATQLAALSAKSLFPSSR